MNVPETLERGQKKKDKVVREVDECGGRKESGGGEGGEWGEERSRERESEGEGEGEGEG